MQGVSEYEITRGLRIIGPWPVLLIEEESAIVATDLHLGIEDQYEREGIHIPKTFLNDIINSIIYPARYVGAKKVILLGDVKHEFGRPEEAEWYASKKLIKEIQKSIGKVEIVRGNHDNYIISILKELSVPLHQPSMKVGEFLLTHGHQDITGELGRKIIIGHEHPSVSIKDDLGIRHRYKAFISTRIGRREIFIMPSASLITIGTDMNLVNPLDLLSPLIRGFDLSEAIPYVIDPGIAVKKFPRLSTL